jgi:hypothetical protein
VSTVFEVPLRPQAQRLSIFLSGAQYNLVVRWNTFSSCWIVDIYDVNDVPLLMNRPMVTGADLLAQFASIGIGGQLIVQSDGVTNVVPTFESLGITGHLYYRVAL